MSALRGIYAIVNEGDGDPVAIAKAALVAGVRVIQYRAKNGVIAGRARAIHALAVSWGALAIMNDDVEAALAFDFHGVHLGPDDDGFARVAAVRERLGLTSIIGLSCGTEAEARAAHASGADYVGAGAVFATTSKPDAGEPIGIEGLARIIAAAPHLPIAAIGGITLENLAAVRATGAAMAAVISAISSAHDHHAAAEALVRAWSPAA